MITASERLINNQGTITYASEISSEIKAKIDFDKLEKKDQYDTFEKRDLSSVMVCETYSKIQYKVSMPKSVFGDQFGYDEMMGYFGLDNLRRANDMLLIDDNFELPNVCSRFYKPDIPEVSDGENVAIIPNVECFNKKYNDRSLEMYKRIFESLKAARKEVYIVCQASSDMEICKELANDFRHFESLYIGFLFIANLPDITSLLLVGNALDVTGFQRFFLL